jgi:hypothetical protein
MLGVVCTLGRMLKYLPHLLFILSSVQLARACKCDTTRDIETLFDQSKVVFQVEILGNSLTTLETNNKTHRALELKYCVVESYKNGESDLRLLQLFDSCTLNLRTGSKYVVFVPEQDWRGVENAIHQCSGTFPAIENEYFGDRLNEVKNYVPKK